MREARARIAAFAPDAALFLAGPGASAVDARSTADALAAPEGARILAGDLFAALAEALETTAERDQDSVAIVRDWAPLLDLDLAREMAADHFRYLAHYTYSDNVPLGLLPDLASREFARAVNPGEIAGGDLREFVFKNVNRFDVEIFYRLPDLRQHRLDLSTATARSRALVRAVRAVAPDTKFAGLAGLLRERPEILRPYPAYIEIELSRSAPFQPVFTPRAADFGGSQPRPVVHSSGGAVEGPALDPALIEKLLEELARDSLHDVTVALGGPGEPLRHPAAEAIIARVLAHDSVRRVYLETYAVDLTPALAARFKNMAGVEKLFIIVRLATLQPDRYRALYGADLLDRVLEHIAVLEKEPPCAVYAEMPRLKENADEIDAYFARFKDSPVQVLLGKFNTYAGRLIERRAADLTPLHHDFCWHLARDLVLNAAGTVPLCKQDPFGLVGPTFDFRSETIADIFARTMGHFRSSVRGEHAAIPMPCLACDEWYTFNG